MMLNMKAIQLAAVLIAAILSAANNISEQCQVHNRRITCRCIGNEEFLLPEEYNYKNITSLSVTGCVSANLHYSSLPEANKLEEVIVQNIDDILDFEIFITSDRIKLLRLSNIGRIPIIPSHMFVSLEAIERLEITDTVIEILEEDFSSINVSHFIMKNVMIEHVSRLNIPEQGTTLSIVNSKLQNIRASLNFVNFLNIQIIDSKFELQKPGLMSIQGDMAIVKNSIFTNVSMNLVAKDSIIINGICAIGKSTLRLAAKYINSTDNQLPNEIAYLRNNNQKQNFSTKFFISNNTVCKAGNCKCIERNGQISCQPIVSTFILSFLLMSLLSSFL